MKDPRKPLTNRTWDRFLMVNFVMVGLWVLVGIWVDYPHLLDQLAATACVLTVFVVLTWPKNRSG